MTLRGCQLTLPCVGKREQAILSISDYFKDVFENWDFKGATLTYSKHKKQFWVRLVFEAETPELQESGEVQGIDRGLYYLASTSDGQFFSGSPIRATQRRYLHNRKTLQQKGTRSAKRRLRAMSGREKRFMKDVNHCVSKQLANQPKFSIFVLEDLSSIRTQRRGKKMKKWLSSWTFYQLELFLACKSERLGKQVKFVDARYTSQKCSVCKHIARTNRTKSRFHCRNCGHKAQTDVNAAINIWDSYIVSAAASQSVEQAAGD